MVQMCRDQILQHAAAEHAAHAGLLLDAYLHNDDPEDRQNLIQDAQQAVRRSRQAYEAAYEVWHENVGGTCVTELVAVDGRAVIGLGAATPLEVGLTLHHTYGVPYLPGSALKGLAAHYCHQVWGASDGKFARDGAAYKVLFGTKEDGGHIIFYDAWLCPDAQDDCLDQDVMTVHHPEYYQDKQGKAPTDFDDPNPITFLSAKGRFLLALRCDVASKSGAAWARLAMTLLQEALANWGIGAKTNAGYGRMSKAGVNAHAAHAVKDSRHRGGVLPCKAGDKVTATLADEKTKKGGWKAVYEADGQQWSGPIQNSADVAANAKPGDKVTLLIRSINARDIAFAWLKEK